MTPKQIRTWLICRPRPTSIRIVDAEQQEHKLELTNGMTWIQAAESVHALQPERLEAFDAKGLLLRATRPSEVPPDESDEHDVVAAGSDVDPENARFILVAKLLAEAYRHSTEVAFEKLAALFEVETRRAESLARRGESLQNTITALLRKQVVTEDSGEEGPVTFQELLMGFLQGLAQGKTEKPAVEDPKTHANGAPPKEDA